MVVCKHLIYLWWPSLRTVKRSTQMSWGYLKDLLHIMGAKLQSTRSFCWLFWKMEYFFLYVINTRTSSGSLFHPSASWLVSVSLTCRGTRRNLLAIHFIAKSWGLEPACCGDTPGSTNYHVESTAPVSWSHHLTSGNNRTSHTQVFVRIKLVS